MRLPNGVTEVDYHLPWEESLLPRPEVGCTVGQLLPRGFDRYLRIFHPFVPWGSDPNSDMVIDRMTSWRDLAVQAAVPFGPTLTWRQLEPVLPIGTSKTRPWAVWDCDLEARTADALFRSLGEREGCDYFFAFGLVATIRSQLHRPLMFSASSLDARAAVVDYLRRSGAPQISTPEYVWPEDRAWIVCTDYDLTSTYVAADADRAIRVLQHPAIEALEVRLTTRVDPHADEQSDLSGEWCT